MSDRHKPHNGRALDGDHRVRAEDVSDLVENPDGANYLRDDVRHGGAVADIGPDAGKHGERIERLVEQNADNVRRVTQRDT